MASPLTPQTCAASDGVSPSIATRQERLSILERQIRKRCFEPHTELVARGFLKRRRGTPRRPQADQVRCVHIFEHPGTAVAHIEIASHREKPGLRAAASSRNRSAWLTRRSHVSSSRSSQLPGFSKAGRGTRTGERCTSHTRRRTHRVPGPNAAHELAFSVAVQFNISTRNAGKRDSCHAFGVRAL